MSGIKEMIRGFQQNDALYDAKEELRKENKKLRAERDELEASLKNLSKMDNIFQATLQSALARNDSTCYNIIAELYEQFLILFGGYVEQARSESVPE